VLGCGVVLVTLRKFLVGVVVFTNFFGALEGYQHKVRSYFFKVKYVLTVKFFF